ncbi:MAG: hypothetical protein GY936_09730 [Ignavibacteriae bacterium]|nr:hypothetical protein [Ignavibacteriota bacterium]
MQRYKLVLTLLVSLTFLWACSEETSNPTESIQQNSEVNYGEQLEKTNGYAQFKITLENLTPATGPGASQPFSPPVIATHAPLFHIFQPHKYASVELRQLAEDAVNPPMLSSLSNSQFVLDVVEGSEGPVFPASSQSYMIKTRFPFKKLSLVAMLVNTNDAFVGANGVRLPHYGSRVYYLKTYDAGTEKNTELHSNIPGPCCGSPLVRVPTHNRISLHKGIKGNGDLDPAIFGWNNPTAKLTITRVY